MKKILISIIICLLLVGCGNSSEKQKVTIHNLPNTNRDQIATILESGNYVIVDVRNPDEYNESHIKGAVNIPVDAIDESVRLDKDKRILVYCKSGKRSSQAFNKLTELGYNVYDMGAMNDIDYLGIE
jgi:rhodanese-related sulfurtransferase